MLMPVNEPYGQWYVTVNDATTARRTEKMCFSDTETEVPVEVRKKVLLIINAVRCNLEFLQPMMIISSIS